ncbi:hypothetical protein [Herpetosiphon sp. NSE202]|uniref:BACON domain-containing protein n=1 Tax=Herpetosiphon sp. NSE202 TaxID=3351349 RepID=UPI00362C9C67
MHEVVNLRKLGLLLVFLFGFVTPAPATPDAPTAQPSAITPWGINGYLTKNERIASGDNVPLLAQKMAQAGAHWSLEELPWAEIEPSNGNFRTSYDIRIKTVADANLGIIGMLLTTPAWAREPSCAGNNNYWCPPSDPAQYAEFAAWMVERYDGDGFNDAPGSPRIAAWQIWNEPNFHETWSSINNNEALRRRRYGEILVASYNAIKQADPTAIVVAGGVYVFDGFSDGLEFLNGNNGAFRQVPAAKNSFDVLGIHPYMPTIAPDAIGTFATVTLEGRLLNSRNWLSNDLGRPNAPIWITEIGWCTSPGSASCPVVSAENQARYLIRSFVIAQQLGVQHINWLQLEDAFNGGHPFSGSELLGNFANNNYQAKPAYTAFQTMAYLLTTATPLGPRAGVHTHNYVGNGNNTGGVYAYRYSRGSTEIDVLWTPGANTTIQVPLTAGKQWIFRTRNNQTFTPTINGTTASIVLTNDPIFIVQKTPASINIQTSVNLLAEVGGEAAAIIPLSNGDSETALNWTISNVSAGLSVTPSSGSLVGTTNLTIRAQVGSLSTGTYTYQFRVNGNGLAPRTVQVTLRVVNQLDPVYLPLVRK